MKNLIALLLATAFIAPVFAQEAVPPPKKERPAKTEKTDKSGKRDLAKNGKKDGQHRAKKERGARKGKKDWAKKGKGPQKDRKDGVKGNKEVLKNK